MKIKKLYPLELKCINNNDADIYLTVGKVYNGYTLGDMTTLQLDDCNVSDRQYKTNRFEIINKEKQMTTINLPVHKTIIVNPLQFNTSTSRVIDAYMYDERIIHIEHSYEFNNSGDPHSSYTLCIDGTKISDKINKGFDIGTIDIYNITDIYTAIAVCNEINQYCFTKFLTECSNYTI